ncbi:hypothetical protein ACFY7C_19400 [Streptomyces sp. NPDC012769]|uniref:hypothetical protein n=1 Tax=Streptomyces sp. NPDC012769 TaxID=3364848 RepID=UPI003699CB76
MFDRMEAAQIDEACEATRALHEAFVRAGFTDDQAFQLVKIQLAAALKKPGLLG